MNGEHALQNIKHLITLSQLKDRCKLCTYLKTSAKKVSGKICPLKTCCPHFVQLLEDEGKSIKFLVEWWKKHHPVTKGEKILILIFNLCLGEHKPLCCHSSNWLINQLSLQSEFSFWVSQLCLHRQSFLRIWWRSRTKEAEYLCRGTEFSQPKLLHQLFKDQMIGRWSFLLNLNWKMSGEIPETNQWCVKLENSLKWKTKSQWLVEIWKLRLWRLVTIHIQVILGKGMLLRETYSRL